MSAHTGAASRSRIRRCLDLYRAGVAILLVAGAAAFLLRATWQQGLGVAVELAGAGLTAGVILYPSYAWLNDALKRTRLSLVQMNTIEATALQMFLGYVTVLVALFLRLGIVPVAVYATAILVSRSMLRSLKYDGHDSPRLSHSPLLTIAHTLGWLGLAAAGLAIGLWWSSQSQDEVAPLRFSGTLILTAWTAAAGLLYLRASTAVLEAQGELASGDTLSFSNNDEQELR